jgi:hypothetical protein
MAFFTDTQNKNCYPLTNFWADLTNNNIGRYNWITPDQYNEMHSSLPSGYTYNGTAWTGDQAAIAEGDNFLSIVIPKIMASQAYKDHGVIIIWTDETESTDDTNTTLPYVIISPLAKGNAYASTLSYSHSSDLKTMDEIFGLAFQTNAIPAAESDAQNDGKYNYVDGRSATINDLSDFFVSATSTALNSSENPSGYKDNVTFTATVTGVGATPTGTVQFATNGIAFGSPAALTNGTASMSTTQLLRGTNLVTAIYSGDAQNQPSTNSLNQVVTNHPPVAGGSFTLYVTLGTPVTVQIVGGKNSPTDVDGDALVITNVSGAVNGTVTTDGTSVTYTATNAATNDSFTYIVSDGFGGSASQTVNVVIDNSVAGQTGHNNLSASMSGGQAVLKYAGIPGYSYALQWTHNLTPPIVWTPLFTNTAATNGMIGSLFFTNTPSGSNDYYRTQYVP